MADDPLYGWPQILADRADELDLLVRRRYPSSHPAHLFFATVVPRVYASDDEIWDWRARFTEQVGAIEQASFTPHEGLEALRYLNTFGIAYQQENDRELLSRLYGAVNQKVHRRAIPEFSEPLPRRRKNARLRVGYISEHMKFHNGALWALGWMRNHGPDIETFAFSLATGTDATEDLYRAAVDHYFHLGKRYQEDVELIKSQGLDVLIYTDIGMGATIGYFAGLRLAPVQCTAWGHPITSGYPTIDYYLSSDLMEPSDGHEHYREELVRLPGAGVCFVSRTLELPSFTKGDLGLDEGLMYLSCQNVMKYLPRYDEVLVRINEVTGRPIVFVSGFNEVLTNAVRTRMKKAGVLAIWLPQMSSLDFLRVQQLADVSIDSIGWSGGNTTIDSLSFGVPVVTLPKLTMRSRHSAAFLTLCGAEGLIAKDTDDFVDLIVDADRRSRAVANMDPRKLFDDTEPVKALDQWMLSLFE